MDRREEIFQQLKEILVPYSTEMVVVIDKPDNYYLNTRHVMKNKKPMYFGSVKANKNYISFHLMPIYVFPDLLESITPELKKRMQGKSCFNFKTEDTSLFQQLKTLTQAGYKKYDSASYL